MTSNIIGKSQIPRLTTGLFPKGIPLGKRPLWGGQATPKSKIPTRAVVSSKL